MVHIRSFLKIYSLEFCDIWQNFFFYLILSNEQTNFVTHLIITVQFNYWLSENPSVKSWSNKFQMVMINIVRCVQILCKLWKSEILRVVFNRSCCHGNHKNVDFYLSIKIFHQYIFHLQSFSLWAATLLLPWFSKWHIIKCNSLFSGNPHL